MIQVKADVRQKGQLSIERTFSRLCILADWPCRSHIEEDNQMIWTELLVWFLAGSLIMLGLVGLYEVAASWRRQM